MAVKALPTGECLDCGTGENRALPMPGESPRVVHESNTPFSHLRRHGNPVDEVFFISDGLSARVK